MRLLARWGAVAVSRLGSLYKTHVLLPGCWWLLWEVGGWQTGILGRQEADRGLSCAKASAGELRWPESGLGCEFLQVTLARCRRDGLRGPASGAPWSRLSWLLRVHRGPWTQRPSVTSVGSVAWRVQPRSAGLRQRLLCLLVFLEMQVEDAG